MIYSLNGKLIHKEAYLAVIECSGVGYACRVTYNTSAKLGEIGCETFLYTYLYVKEDNIELFGFADKQEMHFFKMLLSVSGVGPKMALSILSDIEPHRLALVIVSGDSKVITKTKGVGAKTAQRIVLELKDKVSKETVTADSFSPAGASAPPIGDNASEAITALVALGFTQSQAAEAVGKTDTSLETDKILKSALKILSTQNR